MSAREETLAYLEKHSIKEAIDDVVNAVMKDRPDDPFVVLAESVAAKSVGAKGILDVVAREILDSKGRPTVEVEVRTEQSTFRAACACAPEPPLGKFVIADEAITLRDGDDKRFGGNGMLTAVEIINTKVREKLIGMDPKEQAKLDAKLQAIQQEAIEGGNPAINVTLPVSMAICRAGAHHSNVPLYAHLAQLAGNTVDNTSIPVPIFSLVDGAANADSPNFIQEVSCMPIAAESFADAMLMGSMVQDQLKKICDEQDVMLGTGDSGGLALQMSDANEVLDLVVRAIEESGLGGKMKLCLDIAATDLRMLTTKELDRIRSGGGDEPAAAEDGEAAEEAGGEGAEEGAEDAPAASGGLEEKEPIKYNLQTFSFENREKIESVQRALVAAKKKAEADADAAEAGGEAEPEEEAGGEEEEEPVSAADVIAEMQAAAIDQEESPVVSSDDLREILKELVSKYPVISLEDPFAREDSASFTTLKLDLGEYFAEKLEQQKASDEAAAAANGGGGGDEAAESAEPEAAAAPEGGEGAQKSGEGEDAADAADAAPAPARVDRVECVGGDVECHMQVVGDALLPTDETIKVAQDEITCNALLLDITKRATISASVQEILSCQNEGWGVVVGGQSGETTDDFIADLAVGLQAGQIKAGAPYHSEHQAKYNQLLRLSTIEDGPVYAGSQFRRPNKAD